MQKYNLDRTSIFPLPLDQVGGLCVREGWEKWAGGGQKGKKVQKATEKNAYLVVIEQTSLNPKNSSRCARSYFQGVIRPKLGNVGL